VGAVCLVEALEEAAEAVSRPDRACIRLESIDPALMVPGSGSELTRLFTNLLENAVRHTPPEGTVTVNFFASFNASGSTVYSIISNNCTVCHSGTNNTCPIYSGYEYGMGTASAFLSNSLNVTACSSSKVRLPSQGTTGSSTNSFLLDRLKGISSSPMPPFGSLTGTQIRIIQDWIDQGCQNN